MRKTIRIPLACLPLVLFLCVVLAGCSSPSADLDEFTPTYRISKDDFTRLAKEVTPTDLQSFERKFGHPYSKQWEGNNEVHFAFWGTVGRPMIVMVADSEAFSNDTTIEIIRFEEGAAWTVYDWLGAILWIVFKVVVSLFIIPAFSFGIIAAVVRGFLKPVVYWLQGDLPRWLRDDEPDASGLALLIGIYVPLAVVIVISLFMPSEGFWGFVHYWYLIWPY